MLFVEKLIILPKIQINHAFIILEKLSFTFIPLNNLFLDIFLAEDVGKMNIIHAAFIVVNANKAVGLKSTYLNNEVLLYNQI